MDTNKNREPQREENNPEQEPQEEKHEKRSHRSSAANLDAIITSPTESVRARRSGGSGRMSNTGTNVSYDAPTTAHTPGLSTSTNKTASDEAIDKPHAKPEEERNDTEGNP